MAEEQRDSAWPGRLCVTTDIAVVPARYEAHEAAPTLPDTANWPAVEGCNLAEGHSKLRAKEHRLQSLGLLTASVAHEVATPLAYMGLNLTGVRQLIGELRNLSDVGEIRSDVFDRIVDRLEHHTECAESGTEHIRAVTGEILQFSRDGLEDASPVQLRDVVRRALLLASPELRHTVYTVPVYEETRLVRGNANQLCQLVVNLAVNAARALRERPAEDRELSLCTRDTGDGCVELEVLDNGSGIPEHQLASIFEPFESGSATGSGLGLAICNSIAQSHGGRITVASREGFGTRVVLRLPANR